MFCLPLCKPVRKISVSVAEQFGSRGEARFLWQMQIFTPDSKQVIGSRNRAAAISAYSHIMFSLALGSLNWLNQQIINYAKHPLNLLFVSKDATSYRARHLRDEIKLFPSVTCKYKHHYLKYSLCTFKLTTVAYGTSQDTQNLFSPANLVELRKKGYVTEVWKGMFPAEAPGSSQLPGLSVLLMETRVFGSWTTSSYFNKIGMRWGRSSKHLFLSSDNTRCLDK